jgi:two-component system CheB/CheR fusion protein
VEGDLVRLTQALSNLLNNAVKYTEAGGRIKVTVSREENFVAIRVQDSGVGISPELLPRLFNLFTQAATTSDRAQGGLGIGLALVRKLVEMHGGTVAAHSEGEKRGSEFVVRLPLLAQSARRRWPAAAAAEGRDRPTPRRILVVDDNADSLESLAMLLRCEGHEVYTAADGLEALARAALCRPEIALLDIGMPKLDGVQVGRRIRAEPWGRAMTLIALTGWGQEMDRKRTQAAGFDAHLIKPLDMDALAPYLLPQAGGVAAAVAE